MYGGGAPEIAASLAVQEAAENVSSNRSPLIFSVEVEGELA